MKNLKAYLGKPLPDSRLWAMWIWNMSITEDELVKQLNSFIDKGFGGVCIRPSRDMHPTYLSEEFLLLFEMVLSIAKERSIGVRIADDFSMPWSGFFQNFAEQNSTYRAQKLMCEHTCFVTHKESFEYKIPSESNYFIIAVKSAEGKIDPDHVKDLSSHIKNGAISWKATPGTDWQIFVLKKIWYIDPLGYYIPNIFDPKVAQHYLQMVLEPLYAKYSKYTPHPFEGFICEMPGCLPSETGIPWDDDLVIKYKSRYKKNLIEVLPSLFTEVEDKHARNRSHVYNFILQSMYERFPAFLETWAKKHKFSQWVLCSERDVNKSENNLRDVMAVPTAELASVGLQNQDGTEKGYAIIRALADINAIEYKRETIGIIGRNRLGASATLQSLKGEIDYHAFLGTSKLVLDGCFFNLDQRSYIKTPFNPFWYHPEWNEMNKLCDYAARILSLAREMTRKCPVAVVLPSSSIMADYLMSNDESVRKGMLVLRKVIESLQSKNIEFDVVSEQYLISCSIKTNGEFGTGARARKGNYSAVIFPSARLISNSTFVFLEKLASKKGTVVFVNEAPQGNFDDGISASFTSRVNRLTRKKNDTVHIVPLVDFTSRLAHIERSFSVLVGGKVCPDIQTIAGCGSDYELAVIHNSSLKRDYTAQIEYPAVNHLFYIDCTNGEIHEIENIQKIEGFCSVEIEIAPQQTIILAMSSTKTGGSESKKDKETMISATGTANRSYRVVLKDRWLFTADTMNVLPLASWNVRIGLSRDSGGYSHYYEGYFETEEVPGTCVLMFCEHACSVKSMHSAQCDFEVSVNGINASQFQRSAQAYAGAVDETALNLFCGNNPLKYNIREMVMKGINRVSVRTIGLIHDPGVLHYPPIIAGNFSIKKGSRGWTIDSQKTEATYGSWTKHGFPYLSGCGTYEQVFEIPTEYKRILVKFPQVSGEIIAEVNSVVYDKIQWQPMAIDITKAIEPRRNVIKIKVLNTIDNLLRMNGRASGLLGEVYLDIY